ncbi:putative ankyrin repeat protein [Chloropicon roscoffensis]|uniref:Ankyrin repeat protein n=1 Tax=Chloropicon roscoffensis TaxID=1461544 RepID=A0AAX4PE20_9CHLO
MARGAGEPSTKRAKVDEAKEEEDPLVRRKEEVVRLLERARAKGKGNARAKKELVTLCADFEAKNDKLLRRLPPELWHKILDENLHQNDLLALAMTCRFFRDTTKDLGRKVVTNLKMNRLLELLKSGKIASHTLGWFCWVCDTFEILPGFKWPHERAKGGAVHEGDLVNYAVFLGSVEILRWLVEEKEWEPNETFSGLWVGLGGSVEVLEYLLESGSEFDRNVCMGAAIGGRLEALKWLRDQDPPCPWDAGTCAYAAAGGHLDVLKFLRAQDPPCPWIEDTCAYAAKGGHLEILKWLRAQDPRCPWSELTCAWAALGGHLDVLKWARSQDPACPWSEETCREAARNGHLDVLKWARSQDPPCPWDRHTCFAAAYGGHLEVLKFLRAQDPPCPWDMRTCWGSAYGGHLDVFNWLRSQDPPCPWSRTQCRNAASHFGHQHVIDWIDQREDEGDGEQYWE